jgi:glycerol-3-phosphate acyltransferase PlsX
LAAIYSEVLFDKAKPRVGLLNIGTEDEKGTPLVKEAKALMAADEALNFIGYIEGRDIFSDACEVVVTDGFTGNMVLKVVEGLSMSLLGQFKSAAAAHSPAALSALSPVLKSVMARFDHEEYGGALLLGLSRVFVKVHGSGGARAIRNAVKTARQAVDLDVNRRIVDRLSAANAK